MDQTTAKAEQQGTGLPQAPSLSVHKIQELLQARDDTQRFVGLALLKTLLDNSAEVRQDDEAVRSLWTSLSPRFVDRLLATGSNRANKNAKEMLDLSVSVLHTFAGLLPEGARAEARFTDRMPRLVGAVLHSSDETAKLILQLLRMLVSSANGARALVGVQDLTPLTEIAPANALVLEILSIAWLSCMSAAEDRQDLSRKVNETIQNLASSFTGTDAVTFLEFLGSFLRQADPSILPAEPPWLKAVSGYIQSLVKSRPSREARSAYTNAAAALLQAYPSTAAKLLFAEDRKQEKSSAYLLVNLVLIDIRSSAATLLQQLNTPAYPATARRLASAFDIVCIFVGHLVRSLEDESLEGLVMSPDNLLRIRKAMSETMSVTIEYLRDRWDASVAGAMGLHPDARAASAETATGSHRTLAWDSMADAADDDPLVLAAVRALALWLREDDNDAVRREASGLLDMFVDLYRGSGEGKLDFRSPVLVALEALVELDLGRELFLRHDGWRTLSSDLVDILRGSAAVDGAPEAARGTDIVRVLLRVVEEEPSGTAEDWMDLVTAVAAWNPPDVECPPPEVREVHVAALQLCCALLAGASNGMQSRYRHSMAAVRGIAAQVGRSVGGDRLLGEAMDDVTSTLEGLAVDYK